MEGLEHRGPKMLTDYVSSSILIYKEYQHEHHTVHLMVYHLIWCPKRRRKILHGPVHDRLKEIISEGADEKSWEIIELAIQTDRVHLFLRANPYTEPSDRARPTRGRSSHQMRKAFTPLGSMASLWTQSTFYSTALHVSSETIQKYIERQSKE